MTRFCGWLTTLTIASILALPTAAPAQNVKTHAAPARAPAAAPAARPSFSGGNFARPPMHNAAPHFGGRSLNMNRSPSFNVQRSRSFNVNRSPSFNRSVRGPFIHRSVRGPSFNRTVRGPSINRALRTQRLGTSSTGLRSLRRNGPIATTRALRRNGTVATTGALRQSQQLAVSNQTLRQGRFGTRFAATAGRPRLANIAAHRAWRHGWRARFVPWYGPIFWPYAYSDIFDYSFWPYGYDDGYWFFAYDNFFDGVFWGDDVVPDDDYAYAPAAQRPRATYAGVQQLCTQPGTGITAWPFADIERKVGLNDEQKQLLGDVRKAASDAAATFKASCPANNAFAMTPPGRLQTMTARLQGTLDAVQVVRPALTKFYDSLSDEQKERFNALGPKRQETNAEARAALPESAKACTDAKPGLANMPIARLQTALKPNETQRSALKELQDATAQAVGILQSACPEDMPLTPPGRLEAMEKRLQAMIEAAKTVKPALDDFYASLSAEQKARFNRMGRELIKTAG